MDWVLPVQLRYSNDRDKSQFTALIQARTRDYYTDDRSGEFPRDNIVAINQLGLNAMFVPEEYGGAPLSYVAYLAAVRALRVAISTVLGPLLSGRSR